MTATRRLLVFPLLASLALPIPLLAQAMDAPPPAVGFDDAPQQPQPTTLRLTVSPAAEPTPPLRYRLTYPLVEQTPGDGVPVLLNALLLLPDRSAVRPGAGEREDPKELLDLEPFDVERAKRAVSHYKPSLETAALAAQRSDYVSVNTLREQGIDALLPSLSPQRTLAQAFALRMRVEVAEGRIADAVATARVLYTHATRLGEGQTLLEMLVSIGIASLANTEMQGLLQRPDAPNLYWSLAEIRPITDGRKAMVGEQAWIGFSFRGLDLSRRNELTADDWTRVTERMPGILGMARANGPDDNQRRMEMAAMTAASLPWARGYLKEIGVSDDELAELPPRALVGRAWFEHYERNLQDVVKWWSLPFPQAHAGIQAFEKRLQAERAQTPFNFAAMLLPSLGRARWTIVKLDRELAAMQVVEAIRAHAAAHDGAVPATLAEVTALPVPLDPSTGEPFGYERSGRSFVLTSPAPAGFKITDALRVEVTVR
jgi:hypothetical protein